ncbi:MAG: DUF3786 domain-containing protein [Deltaproteobacteria bacterium]|nr:DUF3786 domain-containing protein [Deltaproteobacteria bacterium]
MTPDEYTMWLERDRTGRNVEELQKTYDRLILQIKRIDPLTIAQTADGSYQGDGVPRIVIQCLHSWFVLDLLPYRIRAEHEALDTLPLKVLALHHLVTAAENEGTGMRVMGKWIDCRSLQHGSILGAHFANSTMQAIGQFFALSESQQISRAMMWGGKPIDLGDRGVLFKLFPRLPVALVHWRGDDEFPPYNKVLFDVSASNYMPTHALAAMTEFLIYRLAEE